MGTSANPVCPLCGGARVTAYHRDKVRRYLACAICALVFVPPDSHLSASAEKACYDLHENQPGDPGYRRFLARLYRPLKARLADDARGLDVGCGPGPTLSLMFEEAGHRVALYDPYYVPDTAVLSETYDFITLSEVVEHMAEPGQELSRLWGCLAAGGWLGIMTKRVRDADAFKSWHYITDPTHVCFFAEETFAWLTDHLSSAVAPATLIVTADDVVLIGKG